MPHTFSHGYALLIGVGEIDEYPKWSLPVTVSDMKGLHALLIDPARCAYPDDREHVRLLHDQTATRQAILDGLAWLSARATHDPDATIVIYYSGHGWLDQETARYYLIPYDVDPFELPSAALAADDFQDALCAIPAKRLLVFIDSCHAEGMAAAKEMASIKLPHGFAPHAPPPALLEALQTGAGRAVFTSSRGDQQSWVRADGTLSVFTHHLLEALQGAANQPGDTVVRLSHLMNHLNRAVSETALQMFNAEQAPFMSIASEDFPVALIQGGKGLPVGGWPAVAQEAQQTIERLSHVKGDHNVIGDVSGDIVQLGDNQVATSGGDYIAGDKKEIQAEHYYEQITVGEDKPAQLAAARSDYLKRLRNRLQVLPMAAIGGEDSLRNAVRLDQVYVELDTLSPVMEHDESEAVRSQVGAFGETDQALSAMEAATQEARLVLLGDPGSGKSTFVKQLAAWLASAGLGEREPPDGWSADLLPILTNLRDLAPHLTELALNDLSSDERNQRIITVLYQQWRADVESLPMPGDWVMEVLDEALTSGAVMVVFDGLDEVPEATRIRVGWMLDALLATYPDIAHVIVTCRIRSYVGDAVLPNFGDHRIAPFADEKIRRFAECWYLAQSDLQGLTPDVAATRASDLIQAALSKELRELAENPLLVTAMAIIHQREVGLPKERVRLYHEAVSVLLHRWQRHRGLRVSGSLGAVLADVHKMRTIMERIAHDAHLQGVNEESALRFGSLIEVLAQPDYLGDVALADEFLHYVDEKAGILVGEGGSERAGHPVTYTFPHRTFREYLAGCYLVSGRPSARRIRPYAATSDSWYLAAQMAGEELLYNRRSAPALLDLMYDLCTMSEPVTEQDWRTALWSGQMAKLMGPAEIVKDEQPDGGCTFLERLTQRLMAIVCEGRLTAPERADAGRILSVLGDPRSGVGVVDGVPDIVWRQVPAGDFWMGDDHGASNEQPAHRLNLPDFRMAKYPVTNAQYAAFVTATNREAPRTWPGNEPPAELMNHPVVDVTWHDAIAFCAWLSAELGETVRLPSEAEWEKAAKGHGKNRRYPWGDDEPDENRCNFDLTIGTTSSVGLYPAGQSPYACQDMSGNVWEWTMSLLGEDFMNPDFGYPYDPTDGREDLAAPDFVARVLRGGAYFNHQGLLRCASRYGWYLEDRYGNGGFRVCAPGP